MSFTLDKKNTLFYYFAIVLIALFSAFFYYNSLEVQSTEKQVNHTNSIINKNSEILLDIVNIETGMRGFILTNKDEFLRPYYQSHQKINQNIAILQMLTKENPSQQVRIKKLKKLIAQRIELATSLIENKNQNQNNKAFEMKTLLHGRELMDSIRNNIDTINREEIGLLNKQKQENSNSINTSNILLILFFVLVLTILVFIYYIFKNYHKINLELISFNKYQKEASQYSLSLIEASRDPLFTISKEGIITDTNQASVNATDVSKENLIGSVFIKYFTEPEKARKGYEEVFSKGFVIDYPLIIKDHKLTDVLFNGSVYRDENNQVIGAVVVARDVTEQKTAEKNLLQSLKEVTDYKLALDASTIVDITDKDGNIVFVNENYIKISKYSFDELVGGNHQIVNSNHHDKAFMSTLWNDISNGKIWHNEIQNKNKAGEFYWLNMTIVPFLDEKGIPYQYVAISIDITNQKTLEKQLTEAKVFAEDAKGKAEIDRAKAEEAVKSKQQFLSNMSHEIRTPMNAIIGFTKVVLKTELTAKQKEYLMAIKMSGDALIVLINDILDLAKVDAGKMTFEKIPFKLKLSIKAMLHLFETKIQEKNLKLITLYDKTIPEVLIGDPLRLHQIVLNLVSNAVKFTQNGSITVALSLVNENENDVDIKFAVIDTGVGIKAKKIDTIFENFQQATSDTSRIFGGTGLGLAIVKQLVQAQGGTIDVVSEFSKGSTFSFTLNFKKTTADAVLEPEIIELNTDIKDTKILVVEDMELNQLLMKTLLDDFGFECEIAANGKIAVEKLRNKTNEKPFDIILMDLQMPVMNGFEATEYIRKTLNSNIPIIALTADVTTIDVAKCKAVGMDDYLSKPVDERLLFSKLVGLIKKPVIIIEQNRIGNMVTQKVKYVDMTYLLQITKSDPKLITELINSYLKQTPTLITTMKQSFHDKDWKLLNATIHKMLPSFTIMGLNPNVTEMARKIQNYALTIELSSEMSDLVLELENVCLQTCEELEIELTNLN